ncbi:NADP-dependent oxidoreductase [Dyella japonica]|uniref:NADP-dependent oxidoreductase n=1 Tax=Dyella japonica DSM 16301 TaxID=1440762 RepID=A0A0G9H563_9GAMM|nr:NADP-dependent oxidoreductase [Dyella japonica]KLD64703.1 NADP-dependent oxidoreductase [Dyella japonica DSM 16301]
MSFKNRQLLLKTRPEGLVSLDHFDLHVATTAELTDGQALVKVLYLSMDPTNRVWMSDVPQYMPPVAIGEVMRGLGIGRVVASKSANYAVGDLVQGLVGWQDYALLDENKMGYWVKLPPKPPVALPTLLGACGFSGITAYYGLDEIAPVQAGETLVVSAAAGSVGSIAGQIGKLRGARVIGIAGGAEKCRHLVEDLGFDVAVDYKADDFKQKLAAATPDGVHVNFENVGGPVMRAVLSRMVNGGRVALCGLIANYAGGARAQDDYSVIIVKRLTVRGFLAFDYKDQARAVRDLVGWVVSGKIKAGETVADGLENAPLVLNRLFDGSHTGKLVLKVSDDD